ncbi:hypothetical protein ZWY2020_002064 [Hordeum vulgare]|nr:hypothetical protein ZWY2020_002064 [Hordeum vulgare]
MRAQGGKNTRRKEKVTMDGEGSKKMTVCVTGAGGFVASWLVKRLLSTGDYTVHGTVRDLGKIDATFDLSRAKDRPDGAGAGASASSFVYAGDRKTGHLKALDGAGERLRLFKADVLDYATVACAVAGCGGSSTSPAPSPPTNPRTQR